MKQPENRSEQTEARMRGWLQRCVRRLDIWMMKFDMVEWRGRIMAANYNTPRWIEPWATLRWKAWSATDRLRPLWGWANLKVMALADKLEAKTPNVRS